ncbi:MAG: hypothetical protein K8L99_16925 [Anaerolineae bacterium]|nr:hypothetical protein [Anaerolineae bacterium]
MKYNDWLNIIEVIPELIRTGDIPENDYSDFNGLCVVSGYIPIKVDALSTAITPPNDESLENFDDIEILDESQTPIGVLIPSAGREVTAPMLLTDPRYVAYLNEVSVDFFGQGPYRFNHHYVVIERDYYENYRADYMHTAPIWGGFFHDENGALYTTCKNIPKQITAITGLKMPEKEHLEKSAKALVQPYAFERFLNQYHLLELLFNYQLVENVRNASDIREGIEVLKVYLNKQFGGELELLRVVIQSRCKRPKDFVSFFTKIFKDAYYSDTAKKIFITYSRSNNDIQKLFKELEKSNTPKDQEIINSVAKSIYDIRCAIAHNKIGEYFLTSADERFVVEIMEPLLQEVLLQAFSS